MEHKLLPGESIIVSLDRGQYWRRLQFISSILTTPLKVSLLSGGLMELGRPPKPYNLTLKRDCEALATKSTFQGDMQRKLFCLFGRWLLLWSCTKPLLKKGTNLLELGEGRKKKEPTPIKIRHMLLSFLFRGFWRLLKIGGSCRSEVTQSEQCNGQCSWGRTTHPTPIISSESVLGALQIFLWGVGQTAGREDN